jgi:16S rRNA (cytidine1402-2'-O)-methyltransferase
MRNESVESAKETISGGAAALAPALYVVATPIGNLEDLGFRALRVLRQCNWIAAEDTRQTRKLLDHYGIQAGVHSLHEHSTRARILELVEQLKGGGSGAYVSDAGTPGLCDPGPGLVSACVEAGVPVVPVPGASAPMALLSILGFSDTGFTFHGFLAREKKEREEWAERAEGIGGLQVFFETPHRILGALEFLRARFPERPAVVGRELTKRFETITRGTCESVARELAAEEPRGEYVLAVSLPAAEKTEPSAESFRGFVKELAELGASQKVLVRALVSHGLRKNEAYRLALEVGGS